MLERQSGEYKMHIEIETVWEKYTILYGIFRFPDNGERKGSHTHTYREGDYDIYCYSWNEEKSRKRRNWNRENKNCSGRKMRKKNPENLQLKYVKQEYSSSNFKKNIPRIQTWQDEQIEKLQNYKAKKRRNNWFKESRSIRKNDKVCKKPYF